MAEVISSPLVVDEVKQRTRRMQVSDKAAVLHGARGVEERRR